MCDRSANIFPVNALPTGALTDSAHHQGVQRLVGMADWLVWIFRRVSKPRRDLSNDTALRALAALGDDQVPLLSEAGQQLRRKALELIRSSRADTSPRLSAWPSKAA